MGRRGYPRMEIEPFGEHLLRTGDLDPVYLALNNSGWDEAQRLRWLVAYAAFYHCGLCCWMSERTGDEFWDAMTVAACDQEPAPPGGKWPRGHERRYFYSQQAQEGIADWRARYGAEPEQMFLYVRGAGGETFPAVAARAREHRSVGNWLSFKMVDLVDACLGAEVDQSDVAPFLYETPRVALLDVWRARHYGMRPADEGAAVLEQLASLRTALSGHTVPHKPGRPLDMFCLETVACKHGSHMSGHYALWTDTDDIGGGLARWVACSPAAAEFQRAMPVREEEPVGSLGL